MIPVVFTDHVLIFYIVLHCVMCMYVWPDTRSPSPGGDSLKLGADAGNMDSPGRASRKSSASSRQSRSKKRGGSGKKSKTKEKHQCA